MLFFYMKAHLFEHAPSPKPLFSTSYTHLFPGSSQASDYRALAHSSENIRGVPPVIPKMEQALSDREEFSGLALFFSACQQAGRNRSRKRPTPQPGEADIELAKGGTEIHRHAEPVPYRVRMRRRRHIRRKVMDPPGKYRPNADDREKEHQREYKEHVARRNHVRRTGRPGFG